MLSSGMAVYRLRLFGPTGKLIAVQRISAQDDAEALSVATEMHQGAQFLGAAYDVWQDERHVAGVAPKTKPRGVTTARVSPKEKPRR
jgi:hypothetical protein